MDRIKRTAVRIVVLLVLCAVTVGILTAAGNISFDAVDAVSKATGEIISREDVSGTYTVLINRKLHQDTETLAEWEKFFRGERYGFIFEDIICYVASSDPSGMEMAQGLQSRLPENQMEIKVVSSAMLAEKARHGVFDVIVLSDEAIEQLGAKDLLSDPDIDVLNI